MRKRILFIGSYLSQQQGSQSPTEFVAQELNHEGFDCTLVSRNKNAFIRLIVCTWAIATGNHSHIVIDVYSNLAFVYTWVGVRIARIRNKYVQLNLHGGKLSEFSHKHPRIVLPTLKKSSLITSPSRSLQEYFGGLQVEVSYLPNPINLKRFSYNRQTIKPYSILWVRAFHQIYNPAFAVKILAKTLEKYPQATLTMVGPDKGELQACLELISKLNLHQKVNITGPINNNQLSDYYHSHAVFINTTSYESFGMAVLEAASCGIPIVSFSVGEIPYIWKNNESILLAEKNNMLQFVEAINQLFSSPELAEKLSLSAHKQSKQLDWQFIKTKWLSIINASTSTIINMKSQDY